MAGPKRTRVVVVANSVSVTEQSMTRTGVSPTVMWRNPASSAARLNAIHSSMGAVAGVRLKMPKSTGP